MTRWSIAAVVGVVALAGCGGQQHGGAALAVTATSGSGSATSYVRCAPPTPRARACAATEADPHALLHPAGPTSTLKVAVEIPAGAPRWLIDRAHWLARSLHDPHPGRLRIRLGRIDAIDLWGNFVCDTTCTYPAGAKPPRGEHASATIDPRDRGVISFALN